MVVQEVVRTVGGARTGLPRLAARIRALIAEEFGVMTGALLLVRPGTVRGAGTAKVRRALLRERYPRGEVHALHAEFGPEIGEPCRGGAA
ncbi:hypothetical protein [Streptomyces melanosporofaciens]|uniref:hypothetical protein n=1 Tax=Streptomyces melanosporofaciens TaxID=67327 RepID=UPI000B84E622|nr:hypothetical protein [Streptomyces melanosporofaciens]